MSTWRLYKVKWLRQSHTVKWKAWDKSLTLSLLSSIIPRLGTFYTLQACRSKDCSNCSYHLKTPGKSKSGLNSLQEEGNIPQDQRKLHICLLLNFNAWIKKKKNQSLESLNVWSSRVGIIHWFKWMNCQRAISSVNSSTLNNKSS